MQSFLSGTFSCWLLLSMTIMAIECVAQPVDFYRDNVWSLGYDHNFFDTVYVSVHFEGGGVSLKPQLYGLNVDNTNAAICDTSGGLMMTTNGMKIVYPDGDAIENGDSLCLYQLNYQNTFSSFGFVTIINSAIMLPVPGETNAYYLFHEELSNTFIYNQYRNVLDVYITKISKDSLSDNLEVIIKSESIKHDTLEHGKISACRHANGRDWWLLFVEFDTGTHYRFLIDSTGVTEQEPLIGEMQVSGAGQNGFTPDGSKYIRAISENWSYTSAIRIFSFDRAEGVFTDETFLDLSDVFWLTGMAVSPNSRFLYAFNFDTIWQFDLEADDIKASQIIVSINDGFYSPFEPLYTMFNLGVLGPDGRIYIGTGNTTDRLHVINYPDREGLACDVQQHSIVLPTYNASMPNFPHFRLGPIDGSPADTLGIDNIPVAGWRHDTLPELVVEFTDNSYYDVQYWAWSFGDGGTDTVEHPVHQYNAAGYYWVCQEVSNDNAADTLCKWVQVGMGSDTIVYNTVGEYGLQIGLRVYPNPTSDFVFVQGDQAIPAGHWLVLTDAMGRECVKSPLAAMISSVDLRGLADGVYFYRIEQADGRVRQAGKVLVNGRR
jgi:PKD domain